MTDLSSYSLPELRDLQTRVAEQIATREADERTKAQQQIMELAKSVGMSVNELMNLKPRTHRSPAALRYENPGDSSQKWSGRGRQPKWVKEHLDAGNSLETLLVRAPTAGHES